MGLLAAIGWKVVDKIDLGLLSVSPHGLGIAVGYVFGGMLMARRGPRYGVAREHVWNMLTRAVIGVIVGARLFYVVGHIGDYITDDPLGMFKIWEGGIVFYGGVFGGIVAAYPYMRKHALSFWKVMDAAAPGFPLGLIFGRIGDLVIGDHLGGPTHLPFGFRYEGGKLPDRTLPVGIVVHQTALYDMWNVLVLLPLVLWLARKRRPDGFLIMFTATWYGGVRILTDFARGCIVGVPCQVHTYLGLRGTQWVSIAIILAGVWYMVRLVRRSRVQVEELGHS